MFQCYVMTDCSLSVSSKEWLECNDDDTIQCLIDEDYGCLDCGSQNDLQFIEVGTRDEDCFWLQCSDCAHESFCESRDCARNDNYGEE